MGNLNKEEIEFLIGCTQCMFDDGMVNWTNKDWDEFERIKKKYDI